MSTLIKENTGAFRSSKGTLIKREFSGVLLKGTLVRKGFEEFKSKNGINYLGAKYKDFDRLILDHFTVQKALL